MEIYYKKKRNIESFNYRIYVCIGLPNWNNTVDLLDIILVNIGQIINHII